MKPPNGLRRGSGSLVAVLLTLALLASGCSVFGGGSYEISAEFTRTYNLFPGSPVRVLGLDVGKVAEINVEPGSDTVTVTMAIDEDIEIPSEASATIVPESLLGERYVQLDPPYDDGQVLAADATIPVDRTMVPFEFDEVLENLNQFVSGLEGTEVGRLFENLAEVLEGNGDEIGTTIDDAQGAIGVLKDNDAELVALASRLADLNETLGTRDEEMGQIIEDWNTLTGSLVDDRGDIDAALGGLVRMTDNLADVLETHRGNLQSDVDTLARVGRTANRNLDQISLLILGGAELFRHAERIIDRDQNWLPLFNEGGERFEEALADSILNRIEGLCLGAGFSEEECESMPLDEIFGERICLDPLVPCPPPGEGGDEGPVPLSDGMRRLAEEEPELAERIIEERAREGEDQASDDTSDDSAGDGGLLSRNGGLLGDDEGDR